MSFAKRVSAGKGPIVLTVTVIVLVIGAIALIVSPGAPSKLVGYWEGPDISQCILAAQLEFKQNGTYRVSSFTDTGYCEGEYHIFKDHDKDVIELRAGGNEQRFPFAIDGDVLKLWENGIEMYHYYRVDGWRCEGAMC